MLAVCTCPRAGRSLEEFQTTECPDHTAILQGSPAVAAVGWGRRVRPEATRKGLYKVTIKTFAVLAKICCIKHITNIYNT